MAKQYIIDILVKKIRNQEVNPITNEIFKLEDIKINEYKEVVRQSL